jgi:hypothetical protein
MESAQHGVGVLRPRPHLKAVLWALLIVVSMGLLGYAATLELEATRSVDDSDAAVAGGLALFFGGPALLTLAFAAISLGLRKVARSWVETVLTVLLVVSAVSLMIPAVIAASAYVLVNS